MCILLYALHIIKEVDCNKKLIFIPVLPKANIAIITKNFVYHGGLARMHCLSLVFQRFNTTYEKSALCCT